VTTEQSAGDQGRRRQVLDAALLVFGRYGFRKTSMDEVARAAGISRPGLYLHFSSKELLFRAAMRKVLDDALAESSARLADDDVPLSERIVAALDAWLGRYIETSIAADIGDLLVSSPELGPMFTEYSGAFEARLEQAIAGSLPVGARERLGITPAEIAETLHVTGNGWKSRVADRSEFVTKMTVAVGLFCRGLELE
jgi:TetR/AcrR family transcriptional regulator of autoinduction and epiphytic fitness